MRQMVYLPRFKMAFGVADISNALKTLGLPSIFDGADHKAGFLGMSDDPDLHVSQVRSD